jgi:hypothetical protein
MSEWKEGTSEQSNELIDVTRSATTMTDTKMGTIGSTFPLELMSLHLNPQQREVPLVCSMQWLVVVNSINKYRDKYSRKSRSKISMIWECTFPICRSFQTPSIKTTLQNVG